MSKSRTAVEEATAAAGTIEPPYDDGSPPPPRRNAVASMTELDTQLAAARASFAAVDADRYRALIRLPSPTHAELEELAGLLVKLRKSTQDVVSDRHDLEVVDELLARLETSGDAPAKSAAAKQAMLDSHAWLLAETAKLQEKHRQTVVAKHAAEQRAAQRSADFLHLQELGKKHPVMLGQLRVDKRLAWLWR